MQELDDQQIFGFHNSSRSSSQDSLDTLLPRIHAQSEKNIKNLSIETKIIKYLKSQGLRFKTDPLEKQQYYYENNHIQIIKESKSPMTPYAPMKAYTPMKPYTPMAQNVVQLDQPKNNYSLNENPLKKRRSVNEGKYCQ